MRVVSGTARGMKLKSPKGMKTRPTTDRVKESIFNIINFKIREGRVLDCFAGSGALGIEALSRGAQSCVFIDQSRESIDIINENLKKARMSDRGRVIESRFERAICSLTDVKFDIIFMDPPYCKDIVGPALLAISENNILSDKGIVVVEHDTKDETPQKIGKLYKGDERKYGNTTVSFYELEE